MVSHQSQPDLVRPDQRALDIGADYTFGVGNGLHVLGEFFQLEASHGIFGQGEGATLSAASIRYPVGLLDAVSGIVYLDSVRHDAYRFVSWQRSYDRWQFYGMGFWNPQQAALYQGQTGQSTGQSLAISPALPTAAADSIWTTPSTSALARSRAPGSRPNRQARL